MVMACNEVVEVVTEYLEGAMAEDDRARFEAHLQRCQDCRTYLEQMKEVIALTGSIEVDVPPQLTLKLQRLVAAWAKGRNRR